MSTHNHRVARHRAVSHKKFIPYRRRTGRREGSGGSNKCTLSAAGRFFLSRGCLAGDAWWMHRGAEASGPRTVGRTSRTKARYANASHKPPQQVHFSEARWAGRKSTKKCIRTYGDRLSHGHLKNLTGAGKDSFG